MNKRKKWIAGTAVLLAIAVCVFVFSGSTEPRYDGRPLSYWITNFSDPKAKVAIAELGTNAVPWLIRRLEEKPSRLASIMNAAIHKIPSRFRPIRRFGGDRSLAAQALGYLGTNATSAIPVLIRQIDWNWGGGSPEPCAGALSEIGTASLSALMNAFKADESRAYPVIETLVRMTEPHWHSRSVEELREIFVVLSALAQHERAEIREGVIVMLWSYPEEIRGEVIAMLKMLTSDPSSSVRSKAVTRLGVIPDLDSASLARITEMRSDADPSVRAAAAQTLREIEDPLAREIYRMRDRYRQPTVEIKLK